MRRESMYNDSLFNAFARSFEARSQSDMSMTEYLESCRSDPMRYANAAERLLAAIGEPQMIDTAKDSRLGRIFSNRTVRTYPAVPAGPDPDREDRAWRRKQSGHLLAGRQGRHPQARDVRAERSRRLQLFRRPEPRQSGHPRIRRDVQGPDQDAAPAADRDAGR